MVGEVAKGQSVWTHQDQARTLVGVRCPGWIGGLNVSGYHWHFLSDDRKLGGHVLDLKVHDGRVRYDMCQDWSVELDGSADFSKADLGRDLHREIHRVENSRGAGKE